MNRPFLLGLTGSIGMGKSTTSGMFREKGIPVWDADATVHRLYATGGAAVEGIRAICPEAVADKSVDRAELANRISSDPSLLSRVETVVHPLVAADRAHFIADMADRGEALVILDIPLLFETGAEAGVDAVLVVSVPADVQRDRVLLRPDMTEERFRTILDRQLPDEEKRRRADYVIETLNLEQTRDAVQDLIQKLRANHV